MMIDGAEKDDEDYAAFAERLSSGAEPIVGAGTPLVGAEAAAHGRALLIESFGSEEAVEEFIRSGRPRLGDEPTRRGASSTVRGRITDDQLAELRGVMADTGRSQSDLVREGIALLLAKHRAA
ncbi:ribbon-helix-helix domain-containing protein [Microbacteriaceae bacterium VKM Ac-2854]|nr:ribbon-helix-helix domain-containing protein [Microbacteriaceae bacterium VKM Ac-2854]